MTMLGFACPRCRMTSHHPTDRERGYCGSCHDYTGVGARLVGGALHGQDVAVRAVPMPAELMEADPDGPYRRTWHRHATGALVYVARAAEVAVHQLRFVVPVSTGRDTGWQTAAACSQLYARELHRWAVEVAGMGWYPVDGMRLSYVPDRRGPVALLSGLIWRAAVPAPVAGELVGAHRAAAG